MAAAGRTRKLVRFQIPDHCHVRGTFFKGPGPGMAVQAFPVVIRVVKLNRMHRRPKPVDVDVVQAIQLGLDGPEHGVIGMAGVTGLVGGNTVILEMSRGNVGGPEISRLSPECAPTVRCNVIWVVDAGDVDKIDLVWNGSETTACVHQSRRGRGIVKRKSMLTLLGSPRAPARRRAVDPT